MVNSLSHCPVLLAIVISVRLTNPGSLIAADLPLPEPQQRFHATGNSLCTELTTPSSGDIIMLARRSCPIQLWNGQTKLAVNLDVPFIAARGQIAMSPDGCVAAFPAVPTRDSRSVFCIVNTRSREQLREIRCNSPTEVASCVSIDKNQRYLATGTSGYQGGLLIDDVQEDASSAARSSISLYELKSLSEGLTPNPVQATPKNSISAVNTAVFARVHRLSFCDKGGRIVSLCEFNGATQIAHFSIPNLELLETYKTDSWHSTLIVDESGSVFASAGTFLRSLSLGSDVLDKGDLLLSAEGEMDKRVLIWKTNLSKECRVLEGHTAGVLSLALIASDRYLLSGGLDERLIIWRIDDLSIHRVFKCQGAVNAFSELDGGKSLAISFSGGDVLIFSTAELLGE